MEHEFRLGPAERQWRPWLGTASQSKHQAIFDAISLDVSTGKLRPGDRLPTQRAVARELGVDLSTVTRAYNRAKSEGLIEATTGRGTFVAHYREIQGTTEASGEQPLNLSMNSPPRVSDAAILSLIGKGVSQAFSKADDTAHFFYQQMNGSISNREAASLFLGRWLQSSDPQRIVLTAGAQAALYTILHLLCTEKRKVAIGHYTYPGIHAAASELQLKLCSVAIDKDGLIPESFEEVCLNEKPRVLYVSPSADNPTTVCLPESRRRHLIDIARRHQVVIIEDDPYRCLIDGKIPSIVDIAPDITWHIATLSKCISPSLRLAYVLSPDSTQATALGAAFQAMMMMASPLLATMVSRWIYSGTIDGMIEAMRAENAARSDIATSVFSSFQYLTNRNVPHFWLHLPEPWSANDFAMAVERAGILVLPSSSFSPVNPMSQSIRIALGATKDRPTLRNALEIIRTMALEPIPRPIKAVV